jgi:pimeloyl-ACP methyl ester carboxylesterase
VTITESLTTTRVETVAQPPIQTPEIWREAIWPVEWLTLRTSQVYRGQGVPRGDRSAVLVVPGFLSGDAVMYEMFSWLGRIGYRPYLSGISVNASCPEQTAHRLTKIVERAHAETGRKVRIVGHSLGGLLGRHVALKRPDLVSQVVYMGSPIRAVRAHPIISAAAGAVAGLRSFANSNRKCMSSECGCGVMDDAMIRMPSSVKHAAIYTRFDGVVDWHDALETDGRRNFEVGGSHVGLVFNPKAYKVLAELLAKTPVA